MATKTTSTKKKTSTRSTTKAAVTKPRAAASTKTKAKTPAKAAKTPKVAVTKIDGAPDTSSKVLTKKELVMRIVQASGMRQGEARKAYEAMMQAVAQALDEGYDLAAPPLGKIKIAKTKETPNGKLVVLRAKLRNKGPVVEAAE